MLRSAFYLFHIARLSDDSVVGRPLMFVLRRKMIGVTAQFDAQPIRRLMSPYDPAGRRESSDPWLRRPRVCAPASVRATVIWHVSGHHRELR